jgi:RecJ-like exonuclease
MTEAIKVEQDYKTKILAALHDLAHGGVTETASFYYFFSESSSLGGVVAGSGINYVLGGKKPLLSLARKDGELHISCRGTQALVSKGLDLGLAMKTVAQQLNGFGGGHKIAAGATINHEKETEFLQQVDTILTHQLGENI